jgi:hypothetical protein
MRCLTILQKCCVDSITELGTNVQISEKAARSFLRLNNVRLHDVDGYSKELFAGGALCPSCNKEVETFVTVLGRRQHGNPVLDIKRRGICLTCDVEIEAPLLKPSES